MSCTREHAFRPRHDIPHMHHLCVLALVEHVKASISIFARGEEYEGGSISGSANEDEAM